MAAPVRITATDWAAPVLADGVPLDLDASLAVYRHSPSGFSWGYGGSGPAQLALAILLHAGVDPDTAVELHQTFKWDTVAHWHDGSHAYKPLDLEVDVAGWLDLNAYGTGGRSR